MKSRLRQLIRTLTLEIIEEDNLEEATVTGNIEGYSTPFAFNSNNGKNKKKKISTNSTGYNIVKRNFK